VMASALMTLGRIPGVERPAIGTIAPFSETGVLVLDVGANADVKPNYLVQFAQMGAVYCEKVMGVANPRVALLNIGGEETKGSELMQEVYVRLGKTAGVNFVGNIEGGEVHHGKADVIVTDGFTGNVAVKVTEGVADFIFRELRASLTSKLRYKLAAMVLRPALLQMRDVPVLLSGNVIRIPGNELFVTEACSGLRSLTALISTAVLLGAVLLRTPVGRVLLLVLAIPIAIVLNGVRVFLTGFFVHFVSPAMGTGFMHATEGWLLFVVSLAAVAALAAFVLLLERRVPRWSRYA